MKYSTQELIQIAELFAEAKSFKDENRPLTKAECFVRVQAGVEVGVGPFAACDGISSIKGKLSFSANIQAALVKASGRYNYVVEELTDQVAKLEFFEKMDSAGWVPVGISEFSIADANKAGLTGRSQMWKTYPRNMLFARALTNGVAWYCPDVTGGLRAYTAEELGGEEEPAELPDSGQYVTVTRDERGNLGVTPLPTVAALEANFEKMAAPLPPAEVLTAGIVASPGAINNPSFTESYSVKKAPGGWVVTVKNENGQGTWDHKITQGQDSAGCSCGAITKKNEPAGCPHAKAVREWVAEQNRAKAPAPAPGDEDSLEENLATLDKWKPGVDGNMIWALGDPVRQMGLWTLWETCLKNGVDVNQLFDVTGGTALPDLPEDEYAAVEMALKALSRKGVK